MDSSLESKKIVLPLTFTNRPLLVSKKVWDQLIRGSKVGKVYNQGVKKDKDKK